ncbi:N-acetylmuramoyl-L-alanine amidase [Alsobacter sp. R-9]
MVRRGSSRTDGAAGAWARRALVAGAVLAGLAGFPLAGLAQGPALPPVEGPRAAPAPLPVAIDAEITGDAATTRLAFIVSQELQPQVRMLERPDRIVVDLPEVNFQLPAQAGRKGRGLVKSFRSGLIGPGRSRIVIDLAGPALPVRVLTEPARGGAATQLVIELKRADRDAFAKAAVSELEAVPVDAHPAKPPQGDSRPVIVLDPGHGGIDTGAIGVGQVVEKDLVFTFARELKAKLEKAGHYRVVLTREGDSFVSLRERVKIAQAQNASLFVSIHADTLVGSAEVRGLTVYTISEKASDAESARLAEKENMADSVAGLDPNEDPAEIAGILGDLTVRETKVYSNLFARTLVGQITAASKLNKNPHRSAGFMVLRAPDVPSVLVELGYLSSKSDVALLTAADWRDKATDAITASVDRFFAQRLAQQSVVSP